MRPGVPWNVKGIEAEAREAAQLAARRAGVSLGEYLTQLIMTEGRPGSAPGYAQSYPQPYQPGDGTYGPQPAPQYQAPLPSPRYPHIVPQPQPQSYAQAFQQHMAQAVPRYEPPQPQQQQQQQYAQQYGQQHGPQHGPQHGQQNGQHYGQPQGAPLLDSQMRANEFTVVAHGLRDLADRLENSERRAQTAIASVNQSVAAMQDRIDAADRVKQLADVAFTSAADALAQSARDQAAAFESLESTVRSVQKRMADIESGNAQWPSKDAITRLETALGQLQKRLGEVETARPDPTNNEAVERLEATLGQLQKRLGEMERARLEFPHKDSLARLETWINDVRHDVADSEKRSREDISQLAKFIHELGTRVDVTERNLANGGSKVSEGVAARLDALEARSASMFDEMRGQLGSIDARLAQANAGKGGGIHQEAFTALKRTVEGLSERVEQSAAAAQSGVHPEAFAALKRSVDTLSSTFDGLTERLDLVAGSSQGPLAGSMDAIGSTLETLTSKIEESERRAADSVSTVSSALKSISSRLEESDRKQAHALHTITRRLDDGERAAQEQARTVEDSLRSLTQRLNVSDQRHKDSISALRLTVDGTVARETANALPIEPFAGRHSTTPNTTTASPSQFTPPPPFTDTPKSGDGLSMDALRTIMAGPLSASAPSHELPSVEPDAFSPPSDEDEIPGFEAKKDGLSFLEQARRAAKRAQEAEAERAPSKRGGPYRDDNKGGRKLGRLAIMCVAGLAVVAGVLALMFTFSSGDGEMNRPSGVDSVNELLNGGRPAAPVDPTPSAASPAEFAPASPIDGATPSAPSVAVEPNGLGVGEADPQPAFMAGQPALPGSGETQIAALEAGAVRGDPTAQFALGLRYAEGNGVPKNDAKAASLVTKAAQQGLTVAEYRLGAIYERGVGLAKDLAQAKTWYERAANGGNCKAMHNLAVLYADGAGVGQNLQEAARWFRAGAEYGLADSQYNLGILLERGMGEAKNLGEAAKWFAIAASQGDAGAAERLEVLKRTMSPADIAVATDAARKFKPKPMNPTANQVPTFSG